MNSKILAAATAAAVVAGAVISSAFIINNNKNDYGNVYSKIVTKNPDFKKYKASDIIVGMIHELDPSVNSVCSTIFLVPPTTDYKTAYMNAISIFENVNPSHGRGFNKYHCVYADGRIDFENVISSASVSCKTKGARKISVFKKGSKGSYGENAEVKEKFLNIEKKPFSLKPSVDKAYEKSYECYNVPNVYYFGVYTLDGRFSLHSNKELGFKMNIDIDIKKSFLGRRIFEGLEKIYDLETLNANICNPEINAKERYKQLPKDTK